VMLVPYPPGIPVAMPGERLGSKESAVFRLILAMEEFGKRFPGFEREVHGIEVDPQGDYWMRAVIETPGGKTNGTAKRAPKSGPPVKRRRKPKVPPDQKIDQGPQQPPETQGPPPGGPTSTPEQR
jgi:arginine decarboxylase